jgi:hypothetical protein
MKDESRAACNGVAVVSRRRGFPPARPFSSFPPHPSFRAPHLSSLISHLFFLAILCLFPSGLCAQEVIRLPAVLPEEQSPPGQLVSHPDSSSQILQSPGDIDMAPAVPQPGQPRLPPGVRNGVFQKVLFDYAWLAPGGANGLGTNDLELQGIFALPCPTINSPLVITPGFEVHYLQGPQNGDLPPRLYDGWVDFRWLSQVTPSLGLDLAITPSVFSDFNQDSSKAFRLPGHAAAAWTWNETTKLVVGAAYLDRPDVELIPIGGVIWMPNADVKFDLIFPHPKILRRIYCWNDTGDENVQDWVYVAAEFNGDAWAIRGVDGLADQVVISDYRLVFGIERRITGGLSSRFEIGYVFGRRIKYSSDTPDLHPTSTVMLRGGLTY